MALSASNLKAGDTYTECLVEDLSRTQIVMYAGASGDYNPVHTDEKFTKEKSPDTRRYLRTACLRWV